MDGVTQQVGKNVLTTAHQEEDRKASDVRVQEKGHVLHESPLHPLDHELAFFKLKICTSLL